MKHLLTITALACIVLSSACNADNADSPANTVTMPEADSAETMQNTGTYNTGDTLTNDTVEIGATQNMQP